MSKRTVEIKKDGIYLDSEKFFLVSGDMHYFRIHEDGWERRLRLMQDFGLTAVTTYVPWNMTEPRRGEFNFEGRADLIRFIETADRLGLKVLLRCSPYLCGEWEMGGLPSWLLKDRTLCLRSSDPEYMAAANEYNKVICDKIRPYLYTNGGPIILVGLENEYGSFGDDREYLQMLCNFYKSEGIDVPFISANGVDEFKYINGTLPDNWNGIDHSAHPSSIPQFEKLREYQPDKPLMSGEAWTGSIQFWGRKFKKGGDGKKMAEYFKTALEMGVCVNFYMFCGGTNFAFMNGALHSVGNKFGYVPLMTSYDYNGPVSEEGTPTEKYFALRDVLDDYLGRPRREHVNPFEYESQAIEKVTLSATAPLFDNLDILSTKRVEKNRTVCMEDLGQDYGYICYRSKIRYTDAMVRHLHIDGVADRATVYIDGEYIGTIQHDEEAPDITFTVKESGSVLTILVENLGRINYGYNIYDRKGILGAVHVDIEEPDGSFLYNYANNMRFTIDCLPLEDINALVFGGEVKINTPVFYKGTFDAKAGVDTFVDMKGAHKGVVWVNGMNLGRFWDIGPQRTLYLPGEILRDTDNTIVVLENYATGDEMTLNFVSESMLCEEITNDLLSTEFRLL